MAKITLKTIDERIAKVRGMADNFNSFVQATAVAIVEHAWKADENGKYSGDVTRAGRLVAALPNSYRREYLIRWFEKACIAIDPRNGYASQSVSKDSKRYVTPADAVAFAGANNWYDAVDADTGERADWYRGPAPKEQEPNTMVDFADNIINFADRTAKQVREGKLRNSDKSLYVLSDDEKDKVNRALGLLRSLGSSLKASSTQDQLKREIELLNEQIEGIAPILEQAKTYEQVTADPATEVADRELDTTATEPVAASA